MNMGLLVNIDNGGTFTDVCISDGQRVLHAKSPTTAHDLTQCLIDVLMRGSQELYGEQDLGRIIENTDYLRYSTTSGTNALIERKGTPVGLMVESGQEDSIYGAASALAEHDLWTAMVPQRPTGISIPEHGEPDNDVITAAVNAMLSVGVQRIVISLPSPTHEDQIKDILLESYPRHLLGAVPFLVSHARNGALPVRCGERVQEKSPAAAPVDLS
jgi:N-methylhydantoinase A/oxoprolinase/acetone carboxylase beta subunit